MDGVGPSLCPSAQCMQNFTFNFTLKREAEFIGKIRLFGVKLPTSILASAAFSKI
jgi:hypothetical protein